MFIWKSIVVAKLINHLILFQYILYSFEWLTESFGIVFHVIGVFFLYILCFFFNSFIRERLWIKESAKKCICNIIIEKGGKKVYKLGETIINSLE